MRAQLDCTQAFLDHCVALHLEQQLTAEIAAEIGEIFRQHAKIPAGALLLALFAGISGTHAATNPEHAPSPDGAMGGVAMKKFTEKK